MRENVGLFKAKVDEYNSVLNLKEDDWVTGYYVKKKVKCTSPHAPIWFDKHFISVAVRNETYEYFEDVSIKPETLCEFIGTIHGKEIFNNDKIKAKQFLFFGDDSVGIIVYNKHELNYIFQEQYTKDTIKLHTLRRLYEGSSDIEVIGNKFEEVESETHS